MQSSGLTGYFISVYVCVCERVRHVVFHKIFIRDDEIFSPSADFWFVAGIVFSSERENDRKRFGDRC